MDIHSATEEAYKKGYEDGKRTNVVYTQLTYANSMCMSVVCSRCNSKIHTAFCGQASNWKYCPMCGARIMRF